MYPVNELELYLRHSRKFGLIEELAMEVPCYDVKDSEIRLISADLHDMLRGDSLLPADRTTFGCLAWQSLSGTMGQERLVDCESSRRCDQLKFTISSW
jgi:hypothetical protein